MNFRIALALLAAPVLALAAPSTPATSPTVDVLGRPVPQADGRPALEFYVNKDTRETLREAAFPFTFAVREAQPRVIVHVDLSDVPSFFRGMAKGEVKKSYRECLQEMAQVFRSHGLNPPDSLGDSLYMIADSDGRPHRALGLSKSFHEPFARAVGADGSELAKGTFPASKGALEKALEHEAPAREARR